MDLRDELVRHYRWLHHHGLNDSHSGNASYRSGDEVWITPTGCCADVVSSSDLVRCALHASHPPPQASLDTQLHLQVYRANPLASAVIHAHPPYALTMTMSGRPFAPIDFEGQYYFNRPVPVVDIPFDLYLAQAPIRVAELLCDHHICVVRGHGVYAQGGSINLAYKWINSFESSARLAWLDRAVRLER
jgi:L-fuculose-phosphate aldolase